MTRKTTSRTKRELEKLRRQRRNGDEPGDPMEVAVELTCIPGRDIGDDPITEEDVDTIESFTVDLETGETERPDRPDPADCSECSTPDCENPSMPFEGESVCEKCAGMPRVDWRPCVRENEGENERGEDHE